ncbi:class II aldolase/adducin family protein [Jhaorihella thermophila]
MRLAWSIYDRGLTFGASGNISVRLDDGWLMTPTGTTMGDLDPRTPVAAGRGRGPCRRRPAHKGGGPASGHV